jgi:hypothetical protein
MSAGRRSALTVIRKETALIGARIHKGNEWKKTLKMSLKI